jgi:hypothetical protein
MGRKPTSARGIARAAQRVVEAFGNATAAIGPIEPGLRLFLVTRGQFSMIDMILHVLAELGPAELSIWTWAIGRDAEGLEALLQHRGILGAGLVVDRAMEPRSGAALDVWRSRFGVNSVRVCKNHAKIARIWTPTRRVLIRGSMNLNHNPRFEQADITEGGADFDLVTAIEADLPVWAPGGSTNAECERSTGVGTAFERSTLAMFGGLKTWAK